MQIDYELLGKTIRTANNAITYYNGGSNKEIELISNLEHNLGFKILESTKITGYENENITLLIENVIYKEDYYLMDIITDILDFKYFTDKQIQDLNTNLKKLIVKYKCICINKYLNKIKYNNELNILKVLIKEKNDEECFIYEHNVIHNLTEYDINDYYYDKAYIIDDCEEDPYKI